MDHFEQQVRERAYYIWEDEGRVFGRAEAHWLMAEAELQAARSVTVQHAAAEASLAPSPAKVLKPKSARAKAASPKAAAVKAASAKPAAAKAAVAKASVAKASVTKTKTARATAAASTALH